MLNFQYFTPTKVVFGKDAELKVGPLVKEEGCKKVLVHYGGQSAKKSGLLDRVCEALKDFDIDYVTLGGVVPNPHLSKVYEGIELCKKEGVDFILAVGGGSVIDSCKAIAYGLGNPEVDVWDLFTGKARPKACYPLGSVLTIAAAGSEMSNSCVITNEEGWYKKALDTDLARPKFAIMNPEITYTLPEYQGDAPCQQVVHKVEDPDFNLYDLVPAPTNTPDDAGPYITLGMCYATHPDTGVHDVTIHRLCIQGKDELSIFFTPGARHIGAMAERAEELGQKLPISISIGVDPAIEIGSCFEAPTTPLGYDELSVAGALRNEPVELCKCLTVNEMAIANAEYVIEGEVIPNVRVQEDQNSHTGYAMPEFPGYTGPASSQCWLIKVKAVTHRENPIMQTCIGPSEEHVSMAGIPTEASIYGMVEKAMPGRLQNVYCGSAGGGKYMAVLQFKKREASDEGRQRQAALLAFSAFSELKHVFLVDEDVDCFDMNDVLWAMNTRFQGDADIITIPGVRCHPLDPSNDPTCSSSIRDHGIACKTIFDCTVPYDQKERFKRARFMEVDPEHWLS